MDYIYIEIFITAYFLQYTEGAGCNAYTGAVIRDYDFDYSTDSITNAGAKLSEREHDNTHRQVEFVLSNNADYQISCSCGIVTMWQFFAWKSGTTIFYVLDGTRVVGKTSVYIGAQSVQNFFEVPLSSDMWIPVKSGYTLGFYTEGEPMITYRDIASNSMYFNSNEAEKNVDEDVASSGFTTDRRYAIAAYVAAAHPPMFVNAPFETTVYTHQIGDIIYTATALDLDGTDTLTYSKTNGDASFVFDTTDLTLSYTLKLSQGTYTVTLRVEDGCNDAVNAIITINLINEGPSFTNLPASTTVSETETSQRTIYTLTATDTADDTVNCTLNSTGPFSFNQVSSVSPIEYDIVQNTSLGYSYPSEKYYDLWISCTDGDATTYSNFQVDVVKNEPPFYNAGSGYLPASVYVERTAGATIYQLNFTDPEADTVNDFSLSCSGACPFSISTAVPFKGIVTTNDILELDSYDVNIVMRDEHDNEAGPYALSVITSGRPYTHNAAPIFVNLDTTIYVMEHTTVGTFLLKVLYTDENPTDTFTLAKVSSNTADTYFNFDTTTGVISVKADINFETTGTGGWEMEITVNDGSEAQHVTVTGTVTFTIVNINEGITLTISSPAISANETLTRGVAFSNPGISSTDVDAGDTAYYTMDCGADSKYFYLDTSTLEVKFAREYDMDSGLSGTATCNVTVRDKKGLSDSGLLTLTVNNINDHYPKFPKNVYVFFLSTTTTFFTEVTNMAATDADSDSFGSTLGTITYNFNPVNPTEDYFQLDVAGVLFVRNLTTYTANTYVFEVIATDSGGLTGTYKCYDNNNYRTTTDLRRRLSELHLATSVCSRRICHYGCNWNDGLERSNCQ
ncbi:protocadherin Fat 4-like isoform X2 [Mercenaria mercenaria]|uniref:protocadherin Fat 4-like isoform X2 n=1 Tax=Mercenaria mercenaria TaxID=6596 RepID=UPI00234F21CF|nr:protocadherin Fat 4-like isoform X2 [Mercenaria mercenaria]